MSLSQPHSVCWSFQMVLCGAFYPNYFVKGESDEEEAMRFMSGRNPFTTVLVSHTIQCNTISFILRRIHTIVNISSFELFTDRVMTQWCDG